MFCLVNWMTKLNKTLLHFGKLGWNCTPKTVQCINMSFKLTFLPNSLSICNIYNWITKHLHCWIFTVYRELHQNWAHNAGDSSQLTGILLTRGQFKLKAAAKFHHKAFTLRCRVKLTLSLPINLWQRNKKQYGDPRMRPDSSTRMFTQQRTLHDNGLTFCEFPKKHHILVIEFVPLVSVALCFCVVYRVFAWRCQITRAVYKQC